MKVISIVLCLLICIFMNYSGIYAQCSGTFGSVFESENRQYKAVLQYEKSNGINELFVELHGKKKNTRVKSRVNLKVPTNSATLLNDGHLIITTRYCGPMDPDTLAMAVYTPSGKILWEKTIDEILPNIPGLYSQGIDSSRWFTGIDSVSSQSINDAVLTLTLIDQNKLDIILLTAKTKYTEVPLIQILMDPDKALRKAFNLRRPNSDEKMVSLLEKIVLLHPTHYESVAVLAENYERNKRFFDSIRLIEPIVNLSPIDDSIVTDDKSIIYESVLYKHRYLAKLYLKNNEYDKAEAIYKKLYNLKPNNIGVVSHYADTLFQLNNADLAKKIINAYSEDLIKTFTGEKYSLSSIQSGIESNNRILRKHGEHDLSKKYLNSLDSLFTDKTDSRFLLSRAEAFVNNGDMQTAIKYYRKAANKNKGINAEMKMARIYFDGDGVEQDLEMAFFWYAKAGEKVNLDYSSYPSPILPLCHFYRQAEPFPGNFDKSFEWCKIAADKGMVRGMFWLAIHYADTESKFYNHNKSIEYLRKVEVENYLGWKITDMRPISPRIIFTGDDYNWIERALSSNLHKNESLSLRILGKMYLGGTVKNIEKANMYLLKSAEKNDAEAMYLLGSLSRAAKNNLDAFNWYSKAAERQFILAHHELAKMHMFGSLGEVKLKLAEEHLDLFTKKYKNAYEDDWNRRIRKHSYLKRTTFPLVENPASNLYKKLEILKNKSNQSNTTAP